MGAIVFDNSVFDSWLTKKSDEILSKVDREKISNEDMLILILKAQTNHFHHMDIEFRQEFERIDERIDSLENKMDKFQVSIDQRFEKMELSIDQRFEKMELSNDKRFEKMEFSNDKRFQKVETKMDQRFEKMWSFHKWQMGIIVTFFAGLYLKIFLG